MRRPIDSSYRVLQSLLLPGIMFATCVLVAQGSYAVEAQDVIAAWARQRTLSHYFAASWQDRRIATDKPRPGVKAKGNNRQAPRAHAHNIAVDFSLSGSAVKYATRGPMWNVDQGEYIYREYTSV